MFGNNLKLLRKRKQKSQEEVSKALQLTRSTYSGYENSAAEPSIETLLAIGKYFKVSIDKLLKSDLSKFNESQWQDLENGFDVDITGKRMRILTTTIDDKDEEYIELIPEKAKAGYTAGFADPEYLKVLPTFQLPFLPKDKKYRSFPISGDSMPPVSDGAYVIGNYVENWQQIKDGYPYVFVTKNDGIVFKIAYNHIHENQTLQLCSTNPLYEPFEIHINEILEVWKFVNYISDDLPQMQLGDDTLTEAVLGIQRDVSHLKNVLKEK